MVILLKNIRMSETGTVLIKETRTGEAVVASWNVIVYDDPINLTSYVTMIFQCSQFDF